MLKPIFFVYMYGSAYLACHFLIILYNFYPFSLANMGNAIIFVNKHVCEFIHTFVGSNNTVTKGC
jgi:hypothetical protein